MCLAIPGRVMSIREPEHGQSELERTGVVDFGGVQKEVNLSLVPEAGVGDYVIVHVGFAISRLDEEEARQTLQYLREMEEASEGLVAAE